MPTLPTKSYTSSSPAGSQGAGTEVGGRLSDRRGRGRKERRDRGPGERQKQQQTLPPRHKRSHKWTLNSVCGCVCVCVCVCVCSISLH